MPAYAGGEKFAGDSIVPRYVNFTADVVNATSVPAIDAQITKGEIASTGNLYKPVNNTLSGSLSQSSQIILSAPGSVKSVDAAQSESVMECSTGSCFTTRSESSNQDSASLFGSKQSSGKGQFYDAVPGRPLTGKLHVPPKKIMRMVGQAIRDWNMIEEVSWNIWL
jgi:hypothetical protein